MDFCKNSMRLAKILNQNEIQWAFGGSSLLYYIGIPLTPRDLDVVIAKKDIEKAKIVLMDSGAELKEERHSDNEFLTEKFYTFMWDDVEIDLMAVPGIRKGEETFIMPFDQKGPWKWVEEGGEKIALCDPEDWLIYYSLMANRETRVSQLKGYLEQSM